MKIGSYEKRWLFQYCTIALIVTTIPYLIAYSLRGDFTFTGFVFGVEDGNTYIAKMFTGTNGAWLFRSPYSSPEQNGFLAFLPYILLGKLATQPAIHSQLVVLYQILRWFTGYLVIFSTYLLISIFIKDIHLRKIATVIGSVGGGLGWLTVFGVGKLVNLDLPLEFYSPETFGFLSFLGLPHLSAARAFLLLGFVFFFTHPASNQNRILAGVCWFSIGFFQPLTIVTGWFLLFVYLLVILVVGIFIHGKDYLVFLKQKSTDFYTAISMVLISSPWVIYNLFMFNRDPYLSIWESQNIILSPPFKDYIFSFSLLLPIALIGLYKILKNGKESTILFPALWVVAFPLLAYSPHNLQRRLPEGIWIAITIVALSVFDGIDSKRRTMLPQLLVVFSLISSIFFLVGSTQAVIVKQDPLFRSLQEIKAFQFFSDVDYGTIVAASYDTSNALPAWSPVFVLTGHGPESINHEEFDLNLLELCSGKLTDREVKQFLDNYSVDYLFFGPNEAVLGSWIPNQYDLFNLVYADPPYYIYEVIDQ